MVVPFSFSVRRTLITSLALLFVISLGGSIWRPGTVGAQGASPIHGVTGPVTIERDAAGVAHVRAGSEVKYLPMRFGSRVVDNTLQGPLTP